MRLHDIFRRITDEDIEHQMQQRYGLGTYIFLGLVAATACLIFLSTDFTISVGVFLIIITGAYNLHLDIMGDRLATYIKHLRN